MIAVPLPWRSLATEAVPAAAATGVAQIGGALTAAPSWLLAVGQAAIVVWFTVKAIDKRLAALHERVNETAGKVETLAGRVNGLRCQAGFKCEGSE